MIKSNKNNSKNDNENDNNDKDIIHNIIINVINERDNILTEFDKLLDNNMYSITNIIEQNDYEDSLQEFDNVIKNFNVDNDSTNSVCIKDSIENKSYNNELVTIL